MSSHRHTANHAIKRDPTLTEQEAAVVAIAFDARVCGTDGDNSFESLGEVLERTERNEQFLDHSLKKMTERVEKLEASLSSLLRRRDRLRIPVR